ncbi:MAG: DUF4430 domain-containing protein [Raoultibacter sp.]
MTEQNREATETERIVPMRDENPPQEPCVPGLEDELALDCKKEGSASVESEGFPSKKKKKIIGAIAACVLVVIIAVAGVGLALNQTKAHDLLSSPTLQTTEQAQKSTSEGKSAASTSANKPTESPAAPASSNPGSAVALPEGAAAVSATKASDSDPALAPAGDASAVPPANGGVEASVQPADPEPAPAPPVQAATISVSVSVSSAAVGGSVSGGAYPAFEQGATAYDALCATGLSINASSSQYGIYVSAIGGLAEKEYGAKSGWVYSVNGTTPMVSCSGYILHEGDRVEWFYAT